VSEAQVVHPNVAIEADFIAADPSHALVDASAQAALVVVGTRGLTAVGESVLGW
jgi:nucleotide-binding universal stress UspA family protein